MAALAYRPKQVRLFLVLLLAVAALLTWKWTPRTGPARLIGIGAEAAILGFFLALPRLFFPAFKLIMAVTNRIGSLLFLVISTVVFFLLLTPLSFLMRLFGKKFLQVRRRAKASTYFEDPAVETSYERQF
jgi:uncharacterized membrane protein